MLCWMGFSQNKKDAILIKKHTSVGKGVVGTFGYTFKVKIRLKVMNQISPFHRSTCKIEI